MCKPYIYTPPPYQYFSSLPSLTPPPLSLFLSLSLSPSLSPPPPSLLLSLSLSPLPTPSLSLPLSLPLFFLYTFHPNRYRYRKPVEHDPTVTFDNLIKIFKDNQIMSRWHDLGKELQFPYRKLRAMSSMEELLRCYTIDDYFNPSWSTVRDALHRMGERQLASNVHTGYVLQKGLREFCMYSSSLHIYEYLYIMQQKNRNSLTLDLVHYPHLTMKPMVKVLILYVLVHNRTLI